MVVIFGDIRLAVVVPVQAPHCVERHIAVDGHGASTEGGQRIAIAALIDSFAVVCGGPADEQHLMAVLVGVGGMILVCGFQSVSVPVVQAGLRLFGRALTAEISAVGVIGQGAVVLVRSAVFVRILRKGDGDGIVGPDITQGEGSAGIAGDLGIPVVAVGISFHCGIVDILLHNGDGVQGVVFLGLDGKFGIRPGEHIAGRGRDGAVASINRSGDAIGLILHVGFAVAVGVIAPYGVDGLILRRDIHRGGEDAVIIAVIQAVNGVLFIQRPAHKGHIFTVNLITGGLELIGGVQPVTGLRRDLLFLSSGGRSTVEISAVGVIGHGALVLCNVGIAVTVGVVAPGGIQGGILGDGVFSASGVNRAWGERVLHTVDFVYGCLGPAHKDGFFACFIQRNGGDLRRKCDLAAGNSLVAGHISGGSPSPRVCIIREGIAARCRIIGIIDGQGGLGGILSLNIPDQTVRLTGKVAVAVGIGGGVPYGRLLRDLIGRAHRQAGDGGCLPGLQLEVSAVLDVNTARTDRDGIFSVQRIHKAFYHGTGVVQAEGIGKFLIWVRIGYVLIYLHRQRPGGGLFGAQAVVAQADGDCGVVHIIDRVAVVDGGAGHVAGLVGAAVGHTAQLGGACFNV